MEKKKPKSTKDRVLDATFDAFNPLPKNIFDWRNDELHLGELRIFDGKVLVPVKTEFETFTTKNSNVIFTKAKKIAIDYVLKYFVKNPSESNQNFLTEKSSVKWHLAPKKKAKVKCLVEIPLESLRFLEDQKQENYRDFYQENQKKSARFDYDGVFDYVLQVIETHNRFMSLLKRSFGFLPEDISNPMKRVGSSLLEFLSALERLVDINLNPYQDLRAKRLDTKTSSITLFFDDDDKISRIAITDDKNRFSSGAYTGFLDFGFVHFKDKLIFDDRIFRKLLFLSLIESERYTKRDGTWQDFFGRYLADLFDLPFNPFELSDLANEGIEKVGGIYKELGDKISGIDDLVLGKVDKVLEDFGFENLPPVPDVFGLDVDIKEKGKVEIREFLRDDEISFVNDKVTLDVAELDTARLGAEAGRIFHEKISIDAVIQTLMECFPWFDFPAFTLELPDLSLPKIPIFDINIVLRIELEKLILYIIKLLIAMLAEFLFGLLKRICEFFDLKPDGVEPGNALVPLVRDKMDPSPLSDMMVELSEELSPEEYCSMVFGSISPRALEVIKEKVANTPALSGQLQDYGDISSFMASIGRTLGLGSVRSLCGGEDLEDFTNACTSDEALYNLVEAQMKAKASAAGISLTPEDLAMQVEAVFGEREEIIESVRSIISSDLIKDKLEESMLAVGNMSLSEFVEVDENSAPFKAASAILDPIESIFFNELESFPEIVNSMKARQNEESVDLFSVSVANHISEGFSGVEIGDRRMSENTKTSLNLFLNTLTKRDARGLLPHEIFLASHRGGNFFGLSREDLSLKSKKDNITKGAYDVSISGEGRDYFRETALLELFLTKFQVKLFYRLNLFWFFLSGFDISPLFPQIIDDIVREMSGDFDALRSIQGDVSDEAEDDSLGIRSEMEEIAQESLSLLNLPKNSLSIEFLWGPNLVSEESDVEDIKFYINRLLSSLSTSFLQPDLSSQPADVLGTKEDSRANTLYVIDQNFLSLQS